MGGPILQACHGTIRPRWPRRQGRLATNQAMMQRGLPSKRAERRWFPSTSRARTGGLGPDTRERASQMAGWILGALSPDPRSSLRSRVGGSPMTPVPSHWLLGIAVHLPTPLCNGLNAIGLRTKHVTRELLRWPMTRNKNRQATRPCILLAWEFLDVDHIIEVQSATCSKSPR